MEWRDAVRAKVNASSRPRGKRLAELIVPPLLLWRKRRVGAAEFDCLVDKRPVSSWQY